MGALLGRNAANRTALPSDVPRLLFATTVELILFGVIFFVALVLARPNADDLMLRWRGAWRPIVDGLLYSVAIRLMIPVIVMFALMIASVAGYNVKEFETLIKNSGSRPDAVVDPKAITGNPLYLFVLTTWVSFIVAGLREELWRAGMIAIGIRLLPTSLPAVRAAAIIVLFSSLLFGVGHVYQGTLAAAGITLIGIALGAIMVSHRSIWPAVIAHGAFNATSFLLLPFADKLTKP